MSNERVRALELRRQQLQLRSAELRHALREQTRPLAAPLVWADRARDAWIWLGRHPEVPLVGVAVLVVMRPARALRWASRIWWAWGVYGKARRLLG